MRCLDAHETTLGSLCALLAFSCTLFLFARTRPSSPLRGCEPTCWRGTSFVGRNSGQGRTLCVCFVPSRIYGVAPKPLVLAVHPAFERLAVVLKQPLAVPVRVPRRSLRSSMSSSSASSSRSDPGSALPRYASSCGIIFKSKCPRKFRRVSAAVYSTAFRTQMQLYVRCCRHGYGLHIEDPSAFPLQLNTTVLGGSDSTDSESDDDLVIRASSQPVMCATCCKPCAGGGPGSSSLSQCNYCEVRGGRFCCCGHAHEHERMLGRGTFCTFAKCTALSARSIWMICVDM